MMMPEKSPARLIRGTEHNQGTSVWQSMGMAVMAVLALLALHDISRGLEPPYQREWATIYLAGLYVGLMLARARSNGPGST